MKKTVVKSIVPSNVVTLSQVDENLFYGVLINENKAFIIQENYRQGNFNTVNAGAGMTYSNGYAQRSSLKDLIGFYLSSKCQVYQFDTAKELFAWLAE
jgi:hypothetical protein